MATASRSKSQQRPRFRASWKGPIRFGLVSFDVEAVNAEIKKKAAFHFHLLHAPDHKRIRYAKVCPDHGDVPNDEIVQGFEYRKGRYIEVDSTELDALRTEKERALTIDAFISPDEVDPLYFDGRGYYLLPAANDAHEGYALLATAMQRRQRYGIGQVVLSGREQLALLRAVDGVLIMVMLNYDVEIRKPSEMKGELARVKTTPRMLTLAENLIRCWEAKHFYFSGYKDHYREKVSQLLQAKRKGEVVEASEEAEEPKVINLIDALKRSLDGVGQRGRRAAKSTHTAKGHRGSPRNGRRTRA